MLVGLVVVEVWIFYDCGVVEVRASMLAGLVAGARVLCLVPRQRLPLGVGLLHG
jgi:hypothetical protein